MAQKALWQKRVDQQLRFDNKHDVFLLWISNEYGVEPLRFEHYSNKVPTYLQLESIPSDRDAGCEYHIVLSMKLTDDLRISSTSTSVMKTCSFKPKG
ncbi:hypothetical protein STH12_00052 [Shewanella khirikhana]|uniref:Uncharacterized protein n=1 Tax=Shewanella khirikhana TaxID=1965282 RepID=A0ABM7CYN6_9GAMM|nr:hypothetical protein STH12_00052 [Shewanella khirikhana]